MIRRTLGDAQWARIEALLPGKKGDRGRSGAGNRLFVDAVLWPARTASPWRDLPAELGNWRTVRCRFLRWTLTGVWGNLFKTMASDPDFEYVLIDVSRANTMRSSELAQELQGSCGRDLSKGGLEARAIGRSRGGLTTKIHAAVDAPGLPVRFELTPGPAGRQPAGRRAGRRA